MATERLEMQHVREILRQKLVLKRSHREVARALGISAGSVAGTVGRAKVLGLSWEQLDAMGDVALETRLYGPRGGRRSGRASPDLAAIHVELRRPGVTLQLLHMEYLDRHPEGYRYTSFCRLYGEWRERRGPTMRQVHIAGEKMFVDYAGKKPHLVDPETGEETEVELFVAVLGASNYTFVEATHTQRVGDFVASNVRAMEFFQGAPRVIVPDQLRSAVTAPNRYEPGIQRTYAEMARYYGTTILPARPASPRDKAKVEVGVQVAERWILARLRNEIIHTLGALNVRIQELLRDLNGRTMRLYKASRRELFERIERAALSPLPADRYTCAEWKQARLNVDYHAEYDGHFYSAPQRLMQEQIWICATSSSVEIFHNNSRVALHARSHERGRHTTITDHMPLSHRSHAEWTPSRIIDWAEMVGPSAALFCKRVIEERKHPQHGYRSCLGVLRLAKRYGNERVDAACQRALIAGARSYRHVESVLRHDLDRVPAVDGDRQESIQLTHENVRGADYYH